VTTETGQRAFIADAMLGRLAKSLRMLGYDVLYRAGIDDAELKRIALREGRVALTRDHEIAETNLPIRIVLIASDHLEDQLLQTVEELDLEVGGELFTRCLVCNVSVESVAAADVRDSVPPYVFETQEHFSRCPSCGKIYWAATHVENAREWLGRVLGKDGPAAGDLPAPPRARNLFVTGRPGVGKTTLIKRVLDDLDADVGGFVTSEIRAAGARVGFAITDLRGDEGVLAHVSIESPFRVGKYGVNREDLERIGVGALDGAIASSDLVVMDEIGRMELCSESFQEAVGRALDSPKPVFGTIQDRENRFLDEVRARPDVEVVRITEANRDDMRKVVAEKLAALLGRGRDVP
jgi:nucleoside-triphosphatase THEP1/uncharacterized protein with PIN domain